MTLITHSANDQYINLVDHYLSLGRDRAAILLDEALDHARQIIGQNPAAGRSHPSVYNKLIWPNVRWIQVHRYWFSFTVIQNEPVIFNILYDTSDMARQASLPPDDTLDVNSLR